MSLRMSLLGLKVLWTVCISNKIQVFCIDINKYEERHKGNRSTLHAIELLTPISR